MLWGNKTKRKIALHEVDSKRNDYQISLLDGSYYFVNPEDLSKIDNWTLPAFIEIEKLDQEPIFTYNLNNLENDVSIKAMLVGYLI